MSAKHLVVILLADPDRTRELAKSVESATIETIACANTEALAAVFNSQQVDLVILENKLPGLFTGLDILSRLHETFFRPNILLIAKTSPDLEGQLRQIGSGTIIDPGTPLASIQIMVEPFLQSARSTSVQIAPAALKLVAYADDIPPMPQLLVKISGYFGRDDVQITDLAQDIQVDPKVTADLLKLTNSSAFGFRRNITKVSDAVALMGVRRTISLIVSSTVAKMQTLLANSISPNDQLWYNLRGVMLASTASTFSGKLGGVSPDNAYVLGLLQDIGILIILKCHGARYNRILKRFRENGLTKLEALESDGLGLTHADVGAALLQRWGLPTTMVSLIQVHHNPSVFQYRSPTEQNFLHAMRTGEAMANWTDTRCAKRYAIFRQLLDHYGKEKAEECKACIGESITKAAESSKLFKLNVPDPAALVDMVQRINESAAAAANLTESDLVPAESDLKMGDPPPEEPVSRRVLVIDDDPNIIKLVSQLLQSKFGLEALPCLSAEEAFRHAPNCVGALVDVHLGSGVNGIDFTRRVRQLGLGMPIIIMSADRTRETVAASVAAGANDYLVKPFNPDLFAHKVGQRIAYLIPKPQ